MKSWPCKVAEIDNAKRLWIDLEEEACESRVPVSEPNCNICWKWPGRLLSHAILSVFLRARE